MPKGSDDQLARDAILDVIYAMREVVVIMGQADNIIISDYLDEAEKLAERIDAPRGRGINAMTTEG